MWTWLHSEWLFLLVPLAMMLACVLMCVFACGFGCGGWRCCGTAQNPEHQSSRSS